MQQEVVFREGRLSIGDAAVVTYKEDGTQLKASPEEGERRGRVGDPIQPTGLLLTFLCGPAMQEPVPLNRKAMAWLRIRQHDAAATPSTSGIPA